MTRVLVELGRFVARLAIGIAIAAVAALLLALVREDGSFADSFRIGCYLVGALALFLSAAGHSPSMRLGVSDPWLTSYFPKVVPQLAKPYSGTTLSSSALLFLTGAALLALAILLEI